MAAAKRKTIPKAVRQQVLAKKYGIVKEKCENVKFYFEEAKNGGDGG